MNRSLILGIDPAKRNFTACLMDTQGAVVMASTDFAMTHAGLEALVARLRPHRAAAARVLVGVEASAALDDNLLAFLNSPPARADGELSVLRLDAGQVARFSAARPIRGKTDKADARRMAEFTRAYGAELDAFQSDPQAQEMARLVNEREQLVHDNTALKNRLQDRLVISFPEFEQVFDEPCSELALHVLRAVPTARACARKRPASLQNLRARKAGHGLGAERAGRLVALAKQSIASATTPNDADAIDYLCARLQLNARRIAQIEAQIKIYIGLSAGQHDAPNAAPASIPEQIRLADSMPGIGPIGAATVVLRCRGLTRFTAGKALAAQLGACPDRHQTGSSKDRARLTHRGDRRTRATFYMLCGAACLFDPAMAFHKWRHQQKGLTPKQAICACMNRYAQILWTLIHDKSSYNHRKAIANAKTHHPELWKTFVQHVLPNLKKLSKEKKIMAQTA